MTDPTTTEVTNEALHPYEPTDRYHEAAKLALQMVEKAAWNDEQGCYIALLQCGHALEILQDHLRSPILCVICLSHFLTPPTTTAVVD